MKRPQHQRRKLGPESLPARERGLKPLASVTAYGNLYADIDGAVSLVALPGEDVTRLFKLSGNSLARNVEAGAPKLFGTVRARSNRAPWCLEWAWTVPGGGVTVADNYDFGRTPLLYFDASVIAAGEGQVLTSLADRLGNLITLSGSLRNWFVPGDTEEESYEPCLRHAALSLVGRQPYRRRTYFDFPMRVYEFSSRTAFHSSGLHSHQFLCRDIHRKLWRVFRYTISQRRFVELPV